MFDDRIYRIVPKSSFRRLQETFLSDLCQSNMEIHADLDPLWSAWCRFAFSVIAYGGIAGPHYFEELLSLEWRHIDQVDEGYILVPRWGGLIPVFIDDIVVCSTLSLRIMTKKLNSPKPSQKSFLPNNFLIPRIEKSEGAIQRTEAIYAKEQFSKWLDGLVQQAQLDVQITPSRLSRVARGRLLEIYDPVIVAAILGLHRYNPAPISQMPRFELYRHRHYSTNEGLINIPQAKEIGRRYPPRIPILRQEPGEINSKAITPDLPPSFKKM